MIVPTLNPSALILVQNGRPSKQLNPSMFFFGPESDRPPRERSEEPVALAASPDAASTDLPRLAGESISNGLPDNISTPQPAKRSRKTAASSERNTSLARKAPGSGPQAGVDVEMTNGHPASLTDMRSPSATEGGADGNGVTVNGVRNDDRMDVDVESVTAELQNQDPGIETMPLPIHTLTTGASIGIQVTPAKAANLAPATNFLHIRGPADRDESGTLTHLVWRPGDSDVLTGIGDNYCKIWKYAGTHSDPMPVPECQSLIEATDTILVSAAAWEPTGEMLAVATYSNNSGQIHLFDGQELTLMEALPASQRAITSLQWYGQGLHLLGLAPLDSDTPSSPTNAGSSILLWDLSQTSGIPGPHSMSVPEILVDMDCTSIGSQGIVCAAGQRAIYLYQGTSELALQQRFTPDSGEGDQWTFVRCAGRGSTKQAFLVTASAESACLWMPYPRASRRGAHEAAITGLELSPQPSLKQEFATSSLDGTIKVWRYDEGVNSIVSLCKLVIGHFSPAMTLSYSPDGLYLAAASYDTFRIWNTEQGHSQSGTWYVGSHEWPGARLKDYDIESVGSDALQVTSADHTLAWDSDSKQIVFGLGYEVSSQPCAIGEPN